MTENEWVFYNNRGDSVAFTFGEGWLHIKTGGRTMALAPDVIFEKRGKIGHYLKEIMGSPKHPILFNRWFIQKLGELLHWDKLVRQWREEAVQEKQWQLESKRLREITKNRPLSERELKRIEKLQKQQLALPEERMVALEELKPHIQSIKATLKFLEPYQYRHFLTKDRHITELGKVGRFLDIEITMSELHTALSLLERVARSLAGEIDYKAKMLSRR